MATTHMLALEGFAVRWKDWTNISADCNHKQHAVYEFRITSKTGKAAIIPRLVAKDKTGALCIGKTTTRVS